MTVRAQRRRRRARGLARDLRGRRRRARSRERRRASKRPPPPWRASSPRGEPVYGVNTGFGKLASVRIADADLASSSATSCSRTPPASASPRPIAATRLMMALKLASLAQGASGVRPATLALLEAMLERGVTPVVPAPGLGRRLGRSRAARPYGRGDDRRRRGRGSAASVLPAAGRARRAGLAPLRTRTEGGARAAQRHAVLDRLCARRPVRGRTRVSRGAGDRRALDRCGARLRRARSIRASIACAGHRGQREVAATLRALMAGSAIRELAPPRRRRVQDPYCLRCQPQVMGACLDLLRQAAATLADRGQRRHRQSADLPRRRRSALGRQFPRRAGRLRRRHDRARRVRDRLARRAAHRDAGRSGAVRPAGVPDAAAGPEFRLHDPAGHRRGAGLGEQAARLSGERRLASRPRPTRRITSRWRRTARGGCGDGAERRSTSSAIEVLAAAQAIDFHAPLRSSAALEAVRARSAPRRAAARRRPLPPPRHRRRRGADRIGRIRRRRGRRPLAGARRMTPRLAPHRAARRAAGRQHPARRDGSRRLRAALRHPLARTARHRLAYPGALRFRRRARRDDRAHGHFAHGHRREPQIPPAPRSIRARRRPSSARRPPSTASRSISGPGARRG